jgi:peptidoglycan hydrolase-like protein with peptidoglycan-binding domain
VSGPLREAQQALRQLGYDPGPIDGVMGKLTAQALNAFQHDRALPETGTLTAATARQLALPN